MKCLQGETSIGRHTIRSGHLSLILVVVDSYWTQEFFPLGQFLQVSEIKAIFPLSCNVYRSKLSHIRGSHLG